MGSDMTSSCEGRDSVWVSALRGCPKGVPDAGVCPYRKGKILQSGPAPPGRGRPATNPVPAGRRGGA
ncbi:hypothetical protein G6F68_021747 [Rhizopus microsporus]|nr:hypothetical protein G6F68_021747 [Rhizopus microsporus]